MVSEGKLSQIEGGSLELHDIYFKVQGIKAMQLTKSADVAALGIEGIASHWKKVMAVETPTSRTEVHGYFLDSSLRSGTLRRVLGDRAIIFKIPTTRKGEKNQSKIVKFMKGARAHISVISHSDNRVFAGFLDLIYDVRTDWATGQQQASSWRHKTSNILRLLYHITTKDGVQLFHSVCPIQLGPDAGSVMVTFYQKPAILELVEKIAQSPVAWLYWWATEELHISHKCMQLILKGCQMDEVYLINETDWDRDSRAVITPFEDAEDEFARRVEEDSLVFDTSALAPPTPPAATVDSTPNAPTQAAPANPTQQETQPTQAPGPAENVTSRGYYVSAEHQAAVEGMDVRDDDSFATRATGAAARVSDATKNTSGAHNFRSRTTVDIKRSYRAECIVKTPSARRKSLQILFAQTTLPICKAHLPLKDPPPRPQVRPQQRIRLRQGWGVGPADMAAQGAVLYWRGCNHSGTVSASAAKWAAQIAPSSIHNSYIQKSSTSASSAPTTSSAPPVTTATPTGIITDYFQRQQTSSTVGLSTPSKGRRRIPTIEELRDARFKYDD
eukprot:scaffold15968_cov46-Cyclotella_meneghiniana.AAC.11